MKKKKRTLFDVTNMLMIKRMLKKKITQEAVSAPDGDEQEGKTPNSVDDLSIKSTKKLTSRRQTIMEEKTGLDEQTLKDSSEASAAIRYDTTAWFVYSAAVIADATPSVVSILGNILTSGLQSPNY